MAWPDNRIDQQVREISGRVAGSEGMEVVDVECKGNPRRLTIRIFIDKPNGITHADCELISTQVGTILDVEQVVPGSYTLEVSSPGLDRRLVKAEDFERFRGKKARLKLRRAREGRRQFTGWLRGFKAGRIALELSEKSAGDESHVIHVEYDEVEQARLVVEL
jgi:ribosome maturation factor RimP